MLKIFLINLERRVERGLNFKKLEELPLNILDFEVYISLSLSPTG